MRHCLVLSCLMFVVTAFPALASDLLVEQTDAWASSYQNVDDPAIAVKTDGDGAAIAFASRGIAKLQRAIAPLAGPMEAVVDVELDRGRSDRWRNNGIAIALSSAPVDEMGRDDWAVVFSTIQQGVVATVSEGGAFWGQLRPNDARKVMQHQGSDIADRFVLTMNGAGGERYSVQWPASALADTALRFHVWRDADNVVRLTIYHGEAPEGPWWEGQATLPESLRQTPLRYATVYVSQEARVFEDIEKANQQEAGSDGTGEGNGLFAGRITAMKAAPLDQAQPRWRAALPAAPLEAQPRPRGVASMWAPEGGLAALRAKFNDPAFADYRAVLMRNAQLDDADAARDKSHFELVALVWAYVLSEDRAYFEKAMQAIDRICRVSDDLSREKFAFPGRMRQALDTREFQLHRYEALAQAYDLLYDELDEARREAIHRALLRSLDQYLERIESKSWWYLNNPSNTIGVGNGGAGLIALALRHEHPELTRRVLETAVPTILKAYIGVADDGACLEGNMYWNYGMSYPLLLGYALQNLEGDDRGLLDSDRLRHAQQYVATNLGGDGRMIPFNDSQPWLNGWMICAAAGSRFDQPLMRWMADHMAERFAEGKTYDEQTRSYYTVGAFLFRDNQPAPEAFPGVPTLSVSESINEAVMRSDASFVPGLVVGIKGNGRNNTHHANEDQGSFVLYARGKMLLLDPGYFEAQSGDHSLPLIGDPDKAALAAQAYAPIVDQWEQGTMRSITVDATQAYRGKRGKGKRQATADLAERVRRVFVMVGDDAVIILDDIDAVEDAATISAQFQFASQQVRTVMPGRLEADYEGVRLAVQIDTPRPPVTELIAREWSKQWVYFQEQVPWLTARVRYPGQASSPALTILRVSEPSHQATPATIERSEDRITVKLDDQRTVTFARRDSGWVAEQP